MPVHNESVEVVDSFIYLGVKVSPNCTSEAEIGRRLSLAWSAFGRLTQIWQDRNIKTVTKIRLLNSTVIPVLLYASETWTLTSRSCSRLDAFQHRCLRHLMQVKWYDHVTNEEVDRRAGNPLSLTTIVKRRRIRLLGHIARLEPDVPARQILAATAFNRPPSGWTRPRGRPQLSWIQQVQSRYKISDLLVLAKDRRQFRELVATVT